MGPSRADSMSQAAPLLYGKYQLLELLARGGMAEVFKAKSYGVEGFEKILVCKRILPELSNNPDFVEMFINEAKIAVTLSHANIVQVFDLGRADDTYFIAMEYVAGLDLATVMRRGKRSNRPLPPELAVYVAGEVAKGLDYAHRRRDAQMRPLGIVHRDVSPQNVLVSYEGEVKLTDFGIAKARHIIEDVQEGVLKGKYAYMAPEQARGDRVDARADIYALGVVLYEALSGANPFEADSTYETLRRVREGDAPPLLQAVPSFPWSSAEVGVEPSAMVERLNRELSDIVSMSMALDAGTRHPNAGRLYEDLIQVLYTSGRRVSAHDLADYMGALRTVEERPREEEDRIIAAFDAEGQLGPSREHTPVEVPPRARSKVTRPVSHRTATGTHPHSEQRDVTLVTIELGGSTSLRPTMSALLKRFGGMPLDDAAATDVVAVFGALDPDGRDTETALRCALRVLRGASSAEPAPSLRLGVHAGRVVVDAAGRPEHDERLTDLLATTRELARNAPVGSALTSAACERAARSLFVFGAFGAGLDASATATGHLLQGERPVTEAYGRFVGRRDELRRIGEVLAMASRSEASLLTIAGEAGTGKTRLMHESRRRLVRGGHDVGFHLATCSPLLRDTPLAAVQEMLRAIFGIEESDTDEALQAKVARVRELGLPPEEQHALSLVLGGTGSMIEHPVTATRPLRDALRRTVAKLTQDRITVLAWDRVEVMDDESQAVVDGLIRDAPARLLVVLAHRTGFVHAWSDVPGHVAIKLAPLSDQECARLAVSRLGVQDLPWDLLEELTSKSAGNPFYLEEYIKALVDAGAIERSGESVVYRREVAEVGVPKTLRGLVASRVARLTPSQRGLLQIAAVAGPRFTIDVVADVAGLAVGEIEPALSVIESRGIVHRVGEGEYAFAHELVRDVVHDGLTLDARRSLHGAVAQAVETLYPDRLDEYAERLAIHHRESGDRRRAVEYLERAAERHLAEQALEGAIASLTRAVDLLQATAEPELPRVMGLYRRIGELAVRARSVDVGIERVRAAIDLAESLADRAEHARFSILLGRLLTLASSFEDARRHLEDAHGTAALLGERALVRDAAIAIAETHSRNGEFLKAIPFIEEALHAAREASDRPAEIRCLVALAHAYGASGTQDDALALLGRARALNAESSDGRVNVELDKLECLVRALTRDYEGAISSGLRALEQAKEYGLSYEAAVNAHNVGECYLRAGDFKRAFSSLRYSYELSKEHGFAKLQALNMQLLGYIDALKFGSEEGRRRVEQAIEFAQQNGYTWDIIEGRYLLGLLHRAQGDFPRAKTELRDALRLALDHGHRLIVEDCEEALRTLGSQPPWDGSATGEGGPPIV
ncbi:MAG: protein kinase [Deltaproteobacteria bacterium]|nr:protein kinase [Deltaproteobacteria bacterium]